MEKQDKAKRYVNDKMFPHIINSTRMNEKQFFTGEDLKEAYLNGWDEALKFSWISVKERLPELKKRVLVAHRLFNKISICIMKRIPHDASNPNNPNWHWSTVVNNDDVIAWMPIPSFDEILEANKDVLKRLKSK